MKNYLPQSSKQTLQQNDTSSKEPPRKYYNFGYRLVNLFFSLFTRPNKRRRSVNYKEKVTTKGKSIEREFTYTEEHSDFE